VEEIDALESQSKVFLGECRQHRMQRCERGALYPVLGGGEITRTLEVHDRPVHRGGERDFCSRN
jgi:hypothetical protein